MIKLKGKLLLAGFWNFSERAYSQVVRFIINVILARILMPSDYGLIGLVAIFFAISESFIEGGFLNALIQKQNRSEEDFSTVFYFNILTAIAFYLIFFMIAPLVSEFYNVQEISKIMRVATVSIIFNSLSIVPRAKLAIILNFKKQAIATTSAISISGLISIILAYKGMGVWALVFQSVTSAFLGSFFLLIIVNWKPSTKISMKSFNELFGFGSKLLIVNVLDRFFRNIYLAIIGKFSTIEQLGYYAKAEQFSQIPATNIAGIIQSVTFPRMCEIQGRRDQLRRIYEQNIRVVSLANFPILIFIAYFSKPIVVFTLTEKWIEVYPFLTLLSIAGLLYPINFLNMNLLMAIGRSDLYLKLELIKKGLTIIMLIITVKHGINAIIYGQIGLVLISLLINSFYSKSLINYGIGNQLKAIIPFLILSIIIVTLAFYFSSFLAGNFAKILIGFLITITLYIGFIYITNFKNVRAEINSIFNRTA